MSDREISSGHPPAGGEGNGAGSGGAVADNHEDVVDQAMDETVSEANGAVEDDEESVELVSSAEPIEMDEETFRQLKRNDPKLAELTIMIDTNSFAIGVDWDKEEGCLRRNTHLKNLDVWVMEPFFGEEPHEASAKELCLSKVCRAIGQNRTMRNLSLMGDYESSIDMDALQPFLEGNSKLRSISLSQCKFRRKQADQIISALRNRRNKGTLRRLDLGSNTFEDWDNTVFEEAFTEELMGVLAAGGYSNLRELEVLDRLGLGGYVQLSKFMTDPECKLENLRIEAVYEFGDEHMGMLTNAIAGNNSLKEIWLDVAHLVSAPVLRSFSAAFVGSSIESLVLSHSRMCPEKASIIGDMLAHSSTLRTFRLLSRGMKDEWFRAVGSSSLEELCISECSVSEQGMAALGESMSKNATLKVLSAQYMTGPHRGWQCFFGNVVDAGKLPLQTLNLGCSHVGDEGVVALSSAFAGENSSLRTLILTRNGISCSGASSLSAMLATNTVLEHLHLDRNDIGDEGATAISAACASSSTLKRLDLSGNNSITSAGRRSFLALLHNRDTSLENLLLGGDVSGFEEIIGFLGILATNATLKTLRLGEVGPQQQRDERVLDALANTLCNKSSVEATFASNHTFHWLVSYPLPDDIGAYLSMNRDGNKFLVARQKILQTHFSEGEVVRTFTGMELAVLPEAIHWMALDEAGHSPLFQLLRSLPALANCRCANTKHASGTKRKLGVCTFLDLLRSLPWPSI